MFQYLSPLMMKNASCQKTTEKFKLLCLTYGFPLDIRFDKGPQSVQLFEQFLADIKVSPTPSSAGNASSNGLAEAAVKSAKLLLRKSLEDKQNYAETLCYFNQSPRSDGFSPSELFHGRRVRSFLPSIDDSIDVAEGKAARERTDLITKSRNQTTQPQPPHKVGSLCYRIKLDGKKETLVHNPCEVVSVRKHRESYYIRDLETDRIYLRNRKYLRTKIPKEEEWNEEEEECSAEEEHTQEEQPQQIPMTYAQAAASPPQSGPMTRSKTKALRQ